MHKLEVMLHFFLSVAYQRLSWEALKKSINGLVNKVSSSHQFHALDLVLIVLSYTLPSSSS